MAEPTLEDFVAKGRKDMPFEERATKFEEAMEPLIKEWGVMPSAALINTGIALVAVPNMKDAWESSKE